MGKSMMIKTFLFSAILLGLPMYSLDAASESEIHEIIGKAKDAKKKVETTQGQEKEEIDEASGDIDEATGDDQSGDESVD